MNAGTGVSCTVANGTATANSTAETTTTASAAVRSRLVAGMVERKMLWSWPVCIVVSCKPASNAPKSSHQMWIVKHWAGRNIQPMYQYRPGAMLHCLLHRTDRKKRGAKKDVAPKDMAQRDMAL
jgi:hypothetical protein